MSEDAVPLCIDLTSALTLADLGQERGLNRFKDAPLLRWLTRKRHAGPGPGSPAEEGHTGGFLALPSRSAVLDWLHEELDKGRHLVLLVSADAALTERISAELGGVDKITPADGAGTAAERKRHALVERFGKGGFDYAGGRASDLIVWEAARNAVVVGDRGLADRVGRVTKVVRVFAPRQVTAHTWIKAMRLHQWAKNVLVFLPALLAHRIVEPQTLRHSVLAFLAFGCCASSVYITNDLFDLAADRRHPRKRHRPFASGLLSVRSGLAASVGLLVVAGLLSVFVGGPYALVLAGYYLLTWAYSLRLKQAAMVDVMTLAGLYTLRIIAGAVATGISLSFWLLAFSVFLFLSLGFAKRYTELFDVRKSGQHVGHARGYGSDDLFLVMSLGTASGYCAVVVTALYINSDDSLALYHQHQRLWLICPLMLFWISRVWLLTSRGHMHDDPVIFALRDWQSLIVVAALGLIVLLSI